MLVDGDRSVQTRRIAKGFGEMLKCCMQGGRKNAYLAEYCICAKAQIENAFLRHPKQKKKISQQSAHTSREILQICDRSKTSDRLPKCFELACVGRHQNTKTNYNTMFFTGGCTFAKGSHFWARRCQIFIRVHTFVQILDTTLRGVALLKKVCKGSALLGIALPIIWKGLHFWTFVPKGSRFS